MQQHTQDMKAKCVECVADWELMKMNIRPTNAIVKPQLNIDKIKTQVKPSFIDCLQHSIAKVKAKGENAHGKRN